MTQSAHVDTFAADHLPPREQWPDLLFTLPELHFPERLNCASILLDRHIEQGRGANRCLLDAHAVWSYGEVHAKASQIAHVLVDDLGVVPGNRVLLRGYNSPMLAVCWLAAIKAGAIAVTTMPLYRAAELGTICRKVRVRHALCESRLSAELGEAAAGIDGFRTLTFSPGDLEERMRAKPEHFENVRTAAGDVAMIGFTSGTTGQPKAAAHFHRDLLASCESYGRHVLRPQAADLFTGSPPLGFTFGLGGLLLFPLHAGASTLLLEKLPAEPLMAAIEKHRVTVAFTAPVAYRAMAEMVSRFDIRSLRTCVSAGETLPLPVWEVWHERTGLKILDGIGSTEMFHIFIGSPEDRVVPGATGEPVPGYIAQIHDDDGNELPPGTIGRLAVKGPTGCTYLDDSRQSAYVRNGWNYPGDAYRVDERGYFWYVARTDDMIIASGYNVSGPEVEQALLGHACVKECAVVGKPDTGRQTHIVKAFVVLSEGYEPGEAMLNELQTFVRARIASFKAPREIEFVDRLPRTETGKVQRFRLRERAAGETA